MTDKLSKDERLTKLWELGPLFVSGTPHSVALGFRFVAIDIGSATLAMDYNPKLIGDTETRVMAGGVVTALLDHTSGLAAISAFDQSVPVATLDMRIDYMRAAEPGKAVIAEARCYKTTRNVAFVRAIAHDGNTEDPVASCQAVFMTTGGGWKNAQKGGPEIKRSES